VRVKKILTDVNAQAMIFELPKDLRLRIGIDVKPFLQQHVFEQQQWWIDISTFAAGVMFH